MRIPFGVYDGICKNPKRIANITIDDFDGGFFCVRLLCHRFDSFLNAHGIAVPTEISIVGFDDIPMCEMITPMFTTVRQDGAQRARLSMEKLRELRDGADVETTIKLPVELVKRESVIAVKN